MLFVPSRQCTCLLSGLLGIHFHDVFLPYLFSKSGRVVPWYVEHLRICPIHHSRMLQFPFFINLREFQALKSKHFEGSFYFIPAQDFCKKVGQVLLGMLFITTWYRAKRGTTRESVHQNDKGVTP